MIAHPHTLPNGPCPGARTFGITVRNCVRCGALLDNGDTHMPITRTPHEQTPTTEARAEAWDALMDEWDANPDDLNGGDLVELLGALRRRLGYPD